MKMAKRTIYIVVSEGASERTYLQALRSFLANRMPLGDDFQPRLNFIPKVTNGGDGGGSFPLVRKAYLACRKSDRRTPIAIWVDVDIYVRNATASERRNAQAYAKKGSIPDFFFSVMNFEDFLALHFDDDLFEQWYAVFKDAGHFDMPLNGIDYAPLFMPIWSAQVARIGTSDMTYSKGDLPVDLVSHETLCNLMRHVSDPRMQAYFRKYTEAQTFAEFLKSCLLEQYSEVFVEMATSWFGSVKVDADIPHDMASARKSITEHFRE